MDSCAPGASGTGTGRSVLLRKVSRHEKLYCAVHSSSTSVRNRSRASSRKDYGLGENPRKQQHSALLLPGSWDVLCYSLVEQKPSINVKLKSLEMLTGTSGDLGSS